MVFLTPYAILVAALSITTGEPGYAIGGVIGLILAPLTQLTGEWLATRGDK